MNLSLVLVTMIVKLNNSTLPQLIVLLFEVLELRKYSRIQILKERFGLLDLSLLNLDEGIAQDARLLLNILEG